MSTIIDVRTPEEFAEGNVPGSVNIPLDLLPLRIEEIRRMEPPIVLCCRSGARSGVALGMLQAAGLEQAANGGGWTALL
ncbi:MAG: rhodanese-like domain-containing protein [Flavobacteriales bacterium]|jgi:rhodanese-related sulfurtransferase|nr:rhodanese-like domain-containing protein [Flavobacteriales bacterium]